MVSPVVLKQSQCFPKVTVKVRRRRPRCVWKEYFPHREPLVCCFKTAARTFAKCGTLCLCDPLDLDALAIGRTNTISLAYMIITWTRVCKLFSTGRTLRFPAVTPVKMLLNISDSFESHSCAVLVADCIVLEKRACQQLLPTCLHVGSGCGSRRFRVIPIVVLVPVATIR